MFIKRSNINKIMSFKTFENINTSSTDTLYHVIETLMQTDRKTLEEMWKKEQEKVNPDLSKKVQQDQDYLYRQYKEFISDAKFALTNIEEFQDGIPAELLDKIAADNNLLSAAISSYASNGDPMEYLPDNL